MQTLKDHTHRHTFAGSALESALKSADSSPEWSAGGGGGGARHRFKGACIRLFWPNIEVKRSVILEMEMRRKRFEL